MWGGGLQEPRAREQERRASEGEKAAKLTKVGVGLLCLLLWGCAACLLASLASCLLALFVCLAVVHPLGIHSFKLQVEEVRNVVAKLAEQDLASAVLRAKERRREVERSRERSRGREVERSRERESVCVCVCVYVYVHVRVGVCFDRGVEVGSSTAQRFRTDRTQIQTHRHTDTQTQTLSAMANSFSAS